MDFLVCDVVPPHLLDALAASEDHQTRQAALDTLVRSHHVRDQRKQHFHAKSRNSEQNDEDSHQNDAQPSLRGIVPDQVLEHVIGSAIDPADRELAQRTIDIKAQLQKDALPAPDAITFGQLNRQIYDMQHAIKQAGKRDETFQLLPGALIRSEGAAPILDIAANQAYDNCATVLAFYWDVFGYAFLDDRTAPIVSSIHFENGYQNAQWVGAPARQMIYGDGGRDLGNFTACLDVIGHEMTVSSSS